MDDRFEKETRFEENEHGYELSFSATIYDGVADEMDKLFNNLETWVTESKNIRTNESNNPRLTELHVKHATPVADKRKRNPALETPLNTNENGRRRKKRGVGASLAKEVDETKNNTVVTRSYRRTILQQSNTIEQQSDCVTATNVSGTSGSTDSDDVGIDKEVNKIADIIANDVKLSSESIVIVEQLNRSGKFCEIKNDHDVDVNDDNNDCVAGGDAAVATADKDMENAMSDEWLTDDESVDEEVKQRTKKTMIIKTSIAQPIFQISTLQKNKPIKTKIRQTATSSSSLAQTDLNNLLQTPNQKTRTEQGAVTRKMAQKLSSGGSVTSLDAPCTSRFGSSSNLQKYKNRLKIQTTPGSASKNLTGSALKRREEERIRMVNLQQQLEEKSSKALEAKEEFLKRRALNERKKREEKERRAAQLREEQEREKKQKLLEVQRKKEEAEEKKLEREEAKRRENEKRQQMNALKQVEAENRKLQEERERQLKLEEAQRKRLEMERQKLEVREKQEKLAALIQSHNSNLQQKALANSFIKKTTEIENCVKITTETCTMNTTYEAGPSKQISSYELTPPPKPIKKPPVPQSYDISEVHSDDESDDERAPKKPVPDWARGNEFVKALKAQYSKPRSEQERIIASIFPPVRLPVDLGDIFQGQQAVSSKYAKRTSSAVWDVSPHRLNHESIDDD